MSEKKSITLTPSHKSLFWWYVLGILLTPLFGVGFYLIWRLYTNHNSISYIITDQTITSSDSRIEQNIDLLTIKSVSVYQKWIGKKFEVGTLTIHTETATMDLIGIEKPHRLAEMIKAAAEAERKRIEAIQKKKPEKPEPSKPGRDDRMDYLTGLWQQGLISNEDFEKERKHFE